MAPSTPPSSSLATLGHIDRLAVTHRDVVPSSREAATTARRAILKALLAFSTSPSNGNYEYELRALLEESVSNATPRRELALALVRLLPHPLMEPIFEENALRPQALRVIETHLPALTEGFENEQSHIKLQKLAEAQPQAEAALDHALASLTSLDRVKQTRTSLMKALNSGASKWLLPPYLPPAFVAGELGEVFARTDAYLDRRFDGRVFDARVAFQGALAKASNTLLEHDTEYARRIESRLLATLGKLVESDFAGNKLAQPASVRVSTTDKRHPLHLVGTPLGLVVIVRNDGPGPADHVTLAVSAEGPVTFDVPKVSIGKVAALGEQRVDLRFTAQEAAIAVRAIIKVSWRDFDGTAHDETTVFDLVAQRTDVDWTRWKGAILYALEPVDPSALVGRRDVLAKLVGMLKAENAGSAIIQGQKRVGKTSIAKALASQAAEEGWHVVYCETGDYIEATVSATISRLATRVCKRLQAQVPALKALTAPASFESLTPLGDFLEEALDAAPGKIVLVLDEFDELPQELYQRDAIGNAFFQTLRSMTGRPRIACVLVGGEKMRHVMSKQGEKLNKWAVIDVDYFDREADWADYRELVQRPAAGVLDFTDDAITSIYDATAGNPFFTNVVCQALLGRSVARRDCHVTSIEVEEAVATAARESAANAFQHFWDDGIVEPTDRARDDRSSQRRRVLIAFADTLRKERPCSSSSIAKHALGVGVDVEGEVRDLVTRKVMKGDAVRGYDFKVPLFFAWLHARGIDEMLSNVGTDAALAERKREEQLRPNATEIVELAKRWIYQGSRISEEKVKAWLDQFETAADQRLMFRILENVRYYGQDVVRRKVADLGDVVRRSVKQRIGTRAVTPEDIIVTYLDGPAKSGSELARLYTEECGLRAEDVVERGALRDKLVEKESAKVVLVLDDFVGTGHSAEVGLRNLNEAIGDVVRVRDVKVVLGVVAAYEAGWKHVQAVSSELKLGVETHCTEVLDETARLFGPKSTAFRDPDERSRAKTLAQKHGAALENKPLGFGDLELAVVFERGCPNNTLPILRCESLQPRWVALFRRG